MNFFKLYHEFTKASEPPANYHAWTAIATVSALLGKKCFVPQGHFTVYPNTYIVLVGPPGVKKSTAMNIGKSLVRSVERVPIAPESSTREALIDDLSANKVLWEVAGVDVSYNQSAAFVGELEQFFGGRHINQQMVGFLTAIWDEPVFKERTRKGGEIVIKSPYFTLLGCCTPAWMNSKLREDVISDGFSRRAIFCLETEPNGFIPWPTFSEHQVELKRQLEEECKRIFQTTGAFRFTQPAYDRWCVEYRKMREDGKAVGDKLANYFSSKHILAMKIAMCISAVLRDDRIVDSSILNLAFTFLGETERKLNEVFSGVGRNELKGYTDRIFKLIQEHGSGPGGVLHGRVLALSASDVTLSEFVEAITVLAESNAIKIEIGPNGQKVYKPNSKVDKTESLNLLELAAQCVPRPNEFIATIPQLHALVSPDALRGHTVKREVQAEQKRGKIDLRKLGLV